MRLLIEIATTDFASTKAAVQGGADRIELCSALSEGGITPSLALIQQCRSSFKLPLFPIIRPRAGDFLYTDEEFAIMLNDVQYCRSMGCDGVVLGLLKSDGHIDEKRTAQLVAAAYPMEVTFHRAFDRCKDPHRAVEQLINLGCQRILTSGQRPVAMEGIALIAELVQLAGERIIIMPGSGVRADNIATIARQTGAVEFHSSVKSVQPSKMEFIHPSFNESTVVSIDSADVIALRHALNS